MREMKAETLPVLKIALVAALIAARSLSVAAQEAPLKEVSTLDQLDRPLEDETIPLNNSPAVEAQTPFGSELPDDLFSIMEDSAEGDDVGEEARRPPEESVACEPGDEEKYLLQRGDELHVVVWPETQLGETMKVRPDGYVSFIFAGEIQAEGRTVCELETEITRAVGRYIKAPKVSVNVSQFREEKAYVLGSVVRPGAYVIRKGDTFMNVLSLAGGVTERALKSKLVWLRKDADSNEVKAAIVNYSDMLLGKNFPPDIRVQDQDLIYVEEGNKPNWTKIQNIVVAIFESVSIINIVNNSF